MTLAYIILAGLIGLATGLAGTITHHETPALIAGCGILAAIICWNPKHPSRNHNENDRRV